MFKRCIKLISAVSGVALVSVSLYAQQGGKPAAPAGPPPSVEDRTASMRKIDGYFPLFWDERTGSMFLEISRFDTDFLLNTGLSAGLGSNDIGLDRGAGGGGGIVRFTRVGPRVLLVQPQQAFRSSSPNPLERKSVEDSFAKSVLWGFTVVGETSGRVLVDATDFFLRDVTNASSRLKPGNYRLDRTRSAFYLPNTKNFPQNTEVDMTLTFVNEATTGRGNASGPADGPDPINTPQVIGGKGGGLFSGSVASVTPSPANVTLREHLSFVQLPDGNYTPRLDDPRSGYGGTVFMDYSTPIGEPMTVHYIRRHRLQKKDPGAAISEPVKPIQYWVDSGAPEDIKKALLEGASWWNQAFEAAGFKNAFKVDVLPEGADPMDIRYNMINWVHRSTRGWSSGGSVSDPRTGEIIKGTVTLGSLRDRQDYMIAEGLLSPYADGTKRNEVAYQMALARIRQLAAHEVGHTLGLSHNYYDSSKGRISVMDYPHPLEKLNADGTVDLSDAYQQHIGDWDKVTIDYGYREFPKGTDEKAALRKILDDAWTQDLRFLTNQDMEVNPRADWWSNGVNQADELNRLMKIRRAALDRIGEKTIREGTPMTMIEEPFVPIFLYHRWAVEGTASMLGGQDYIYAIRGDGRTPTKWETAENQRKAIDALAATLQPSELTVPRNLLGLIPPRPPGYGYHRELFPRTTGDAFDPLAPGTIASDVTIGFALIPDRAARLVAQHAVDPSLPGLEEVIDRLTKATFDAATSSPYEEEIRRAEERVLVDRLTWLAAAAPNSQVRAVATLKLDQIGTRLRGESAKNDADRAQHMLLAADIKRFLERPAEVQKVIPTAIAPPAAPIGGDIGQDWLARPSWCDWDDAAPGAWLFYQPPF